jgi:O-antigen/teichoic acid export membrane protein
MSILSKFNFFKKSQDAIIANAIALRFFSLIALFLNQILVPIIFLYYTSLDTLGLWSFTIAIASFTSLLDFGLIQVITTAALQFYAKNERDRARLILNSLFNYLVFIFICVISCLIILKILLSSSLSHDQIFKFNLISLYFVNISLILFLRYFEGTFRIIGKNIGLKVIIFQSYIDLAIIVINLSHKNNLQIIVIEMIAVKCLQVVILIFRFQLKTGFIQVISPQQIFFILKEYIYLGISYLGMPLGYLALNEVSNILVGTFLGLKALGIYAILKSISGIFRQVTGVFTISIMPKMSGLLAMNEILDLRKIFGKMYKLLITLNTMLLILLILTYKPLISKVEVLNSITFIVYFIFLFSAYLDVWWLVDSSLIVADNKHIGLSNRFLISTIVSCFFGFFLLVKYGISGIALGALMVDIILIPYCIKKRNTILYPST